MSVTEARWPRSTATGSGGGLLLILRSSLGVMKKLLCMKKNLLRELTQLECECFQLKQNPR